MRAFSVLCTASCSAALLVFAGCASTSEAGPTEANAAAATSSSKETKGLDVPAMLARELAELPRHDVTVPSPAFTASVEGSAAPTYTPGENAGSLAIALGTQSPINCSVQPDRIDTASTLGRMVGLVAGNPKLKLREVRTVDFAVAREAPLFFAEMTYTADTPGGQAVGMLKVGIFAHPQLSMVCTHDEVGYRESFRRIVKGLATSVELSEPAADTRFAEIQVLRLNEQPVGFMLRSIEDGDDGATVFSSVTSTVLMRTPTEPLASDSYVNEVTDQSGHVTKAVHVEVSSGEIETQLALERDGKSYRYSGKWQGKSLEGHFESDALPGELVHAKLLREHLAKKAKAVLTLPTYSASTDPTQPTPISYRPMDAERAVEVELGGMKMGAKVDEHGLVQDLRVPIGKLTLVQTRVYSRGRP